MDPAGYRVRFFVRPHLYERAWFLVGCGAIGLLIPVGAWRFRVGRLRNQFSLLMGERARLSREIHDTLLQGLFGVVLQCDGIAKDLDRSSSDDIRGRLVRLRLDAERYVREARQSISDLRSQKLESGDLPEALRRLAQRTLEGSPLIFRLAVTGSPSPGWTGVEEQLLRIGQEALFNSVRHAQATEIKMELKCSPRSVVLRISDNGDGFDLNRVSDGHFGLLSMKERAEAVGGNLKITTGIGRGTEIEASIPIRRSLLRVSGRA